MGVLMDQDERVAHLARVVTVWCHVTEQDFDTDLAEGIVANPATLQLFGFSDEELMQSGIQARTRRGDVWALPLAEWVDAAQRWREAEEESRLFVTWLNRIVAESDVPSDPGLRRQLETVVRWRLRHRWFYRTALPSRPRWVVPLDEVPGIQHLEPDVVETQLALMLAATSPHGQFSSTGTGECFVGYHRGYHRQTDRIYVDGLSVVLDRAASILDDHRRGAFPIPGGRFYVTPAGQVICAACRVQITVLGISRADSLRSTCTGRD
jgi:hypothetical protein